MNPYVSVSLVMCVIVILSLIATAYMATYFNKRAKADLQVAMEPLAAVVEGELDLEDAFVRGRYGGHIAEGQMATSIIGAGRVFHTSVIDGAGGSKWAYNSSTSRSQPDLPEVTFESEDSSLESKLSGAILPLFEESLKGTAWTRLEYDPAPGHVRLTKPMKTRHDIPSTQTFRGHLDILVAAAAANRAEQHPEA